MRIWLEFTRVQPKSTLLVAYDDISSVYLVSDGEYNVVVVATKSGSHFSVEGALDVIQQRVKAAGERE